MALFATAAFSALFVVSPCGALQLESRKTAAASWDVAYGDFACPCVGIVGLTGFTSVTIGVDTVVDMYPSDVGSSCDAWDDGRYPGLCIGNAYTDADWCSSKWCYVDPCNCNIATIPTPLDYLFGATYQGKRIFYSYATCASNNTYDPPMSIAQTAECSKTWDATTYGLESCPCVGIDGLTGTTTVTIGGMTFDNLYPNEIGSSCKAWDDNRYPGSCTGNAATDADWCSSKWCYVDKSTCTGLSEGPYKSTYLADGKFKGNKLFYSYITCNQPNTYD